MGLHTVEVDAWLAEPGAWDTVIDARSPSEHADDHLPGASNWPVLDDEQRRVVGTLYKQVSPHEARKVGAALVARNIADAIERHVAERPRDWRPLVYCWRGGQRSGTLAWFLGEIGFRTGRLAGGYKAFRARVRQDLATGPLPPRWHVLAGRTGSGKTRLLHALREAGAQVLDLEGLACHRGSVLGGLPTIPQPSQKRFDTALWQALRALDPARPVFVESESRRIGLLHLPDALLGAMREGSTCHVVEMPLAQRVDLLLEDYAHFQADPEAFCRALGGLVELRGREVVERWRQAARVGDWRALFTALVQDHYDPLYQRSMSSHYALSRAATVDLPDGRAPTLATVARHLVDATERA